MKNSLRIVECTNQDYAQALKSLHQKGQSLPLLQAPFYGAWQDCDGKEVIYFLIHESTALIGAGLGIKYEAPGGISFFYCPYGPITKKWSPELYQTLQSFFKPIAKRSRVTFVRLDNSELSTAGLAKPVPNYLAVTASLQPRAEWLLDISKAQEDIWMGMHKHARYNIRLAERAKAELTLFEPAQAPLDTFFGLMETTAGRDSFSIQSRSYYEAVLQSIPANSGFVALCTIDQKPAAAGIFAAYDKTVHYVFAGSSNDFRKIAPPYFLIWNTVLEAKKRGWHTLNFGGISDPVKGKHLAGVTGFKKRFGGYEVDHPNPVDIVYDRFRYSLFTIYKRLR